MGGRGVACHSRMRLITRLPRNRSKYHHKPVARRVRTIVGNSSRGIAASTEYLYISCNEFDSLCPNYRTNVSRTRLISISPSLLIIDGVSKFDSTVITVDNSATISHQNARESSRGINPSASRRRCLVWGNNAPHEMNSPSWYISRMSCICMSETKGGSG